MTVGGKEESRKVYNNSTYKVSNKIMAVGLAGASPEAAAAIKNAIATQNEEVIRSTVSQWSGGAATQPAEQQPAGSGQPASPQ